MMSDSPLYVVNMLYCRCLKKKLLWPKAAQTRTRQENETKFREKEGKSQGDTM